MLKKTSSAFVICAILILSSCSTTNKSKSADYDYMYITKTGIIQKPLITDLDVEKTKVTVTKTYNNISVNGAKENVMADFIKEQNCDIIIQPYFTTSSVASSTKTTITVTVTGYPGHYRNIRPYDPKDTIYLLPIRHIGISRKELSMAEPVAPAKKKNQALTMIMGN